MTFKFQTSCIPGTDTLSVSAHRKAQHWSKIPVANDCPRLDRFSWSKRIKCSFSPSPPPPKKKMPDHRLNLNLVARVLSYPPFRARERGLDRVGRREPWEQGWLNLKSIWDRTVQIVTRNENTAGWRGFWWMAQFSFQPFPCMLVNQRENLLLDQDPLWASHHAPLCGWVSTPAPFSYNYDCGSGHLISLSWNS